MRVVLALDKFKGTFSAAEACEALADGIRASNPKIDILLRPMADGGEGTARILSAALGLETLRVPLPDLAGKTSEAFVHWQNARRIAIVESAEVLGAARAGGWTPGVPLQESHSGSLGRLLLRALDLRPQEIWIGIGGTLTADGGWGLAHAFGLRAVDATGRTVEPALANVDNIDHFLPYQPPEFFRKTRFVALCDVDAPALGHGVSLAHFLPQKGVTGADEIALTVKRISTLWSHLRRVNPDLAALEDPYTGAGGGLVLGLQTLFPQLRIELGARKVAQTTALGASLQLADFAVCGEGGFDMSTHYGKASSVVSRLAHEHHGRVLGVFGHMEESERATGAARLGCEKVFSLFEKKSTLPLPELARLSQKRFAEIGSLIAQEIGRAR